VPKIIVIGEAGQLARALRALQWPAGCALSFHGRNSLNGDFSPNLFRDLARSEGANLVLNAAGYTSVDRAESEPQAAQALNASLPQALATACGDLDIPLVHVSTDYVFDGQKRSPYLETDEPKPLNIYGSTKLAGDTGVRASALARWAILRTSWVVSEAADTFPVKLLRRAQAGEALRVVDDQWGCPTAVSDLARAMQRIGLQLLDGDPAASGLFNLSGASEMSWHGFAERLLAAAEALALARPPLRAITSMELNAPAKRPAYSVLSCMRIRQACGVSGVPIEADIERMVRAILAR
jgi:dTDP-4-dehydrorhamnose reductase